MEDNIDTQAVGQNIAGNMTPARKDGFAGGESGASVFLKGEDLKKLVIFSDLMTPKFDG